MKTISDTLSDDFCEAIINTGMNSESCMITVVDGDHAGEKAIISDGKLSWMNCEKGFITSHEKAIKRIDNTGITLVDGINVYTERFGRQRRLVICGAGHISIPLITIGKMAGFNVTVIDDRLKFANKAISSGADEVIFKSFEAALADVPGSIDTFFVIVTRGHRYDKDCLRLIISKPHAYIGMMGSMRRILIVKNELESEGVSRVDLDSVYSPIGLDIGAETPEEIAIAIMAEIIAVRSRQERCIGFSNDIIKAIRSGDREPLVIATIISRQGSAPREVGTKMLIEKNGEIIGTIGGGCIEGTVIAKGRRMLLDGYHDPVILEVDMTNEMAEDEGMVCGGKVQVMLETI